MIIIRILHRQITLIKKNIKFCLNSIGMAIGLLFILLFYMYGIFKAVLIYLVFPLYIFISSILHWRDYEYIKEKNKVLKRCFYICFCSFFIFLELYDYLNIKEKLRIHHILDIYISTEESFLIHHILFLAIIVFIMIIHLKKSEKNENSYTYHLSKIIADYKVLSVDWWCAKYFKAKFLVKNLLGKCEIEENKLKNTCMYRNEKARLLKGFNKTNLIFTVIILSIYIIDIVLDLFVRKQEVSKISFDNYFIVLNVFVVIRVISRTIEIIYAFYKDVEEENKTSSLMNGNRLQLAVWSYIEMILLYAIIYYISGVFYEDNLFDNIVRSFGIMSFTDIDLTYYINLTSDEKLTYNSLYVILDNYDYNWLTLFVNEIWIRVVMGLQIVTSMTLVVFSIAKYLGGENCKNNYLHKKEKEKLDFIKQIRELEYLHDGTRNNKLEELILKRIREINVGAFYEKKKNEEVSYFKEIMQKNDDVSISDLRKYVKKWNRIEKLLLLNPKIDEEDILSILDIEDNRINKLLVNKIRKEQLAIKK